LTNFNQLTVEIYSMKTSIISKQLSQPVPTHTHVITKGNTYQQ